MAGGLGAIGEGKPLEVVAAAERACAVIEASGHDLESAPKWGSLTYALDGDFHHWICSVGMTKKRAVLTFHFGGVLEDPGQLFVAGSSKLLRRLDYASVDEIDAEVILGSLGQAVERYPAFRDGWRELT